MILWCIAAFTAYFVKGLCGFANTLVFTGMKCCGHMNESSIRRITTVLLVLSGISLVLKNL